MTSDGWSHTRELQSSYGQRRAKNVGRTHKALGKCSHLTFCPPKNCPLFLPELWLATGLGRTSSWLTNGDNPKMESTHLEVWDVGDRPCQMTLEPPCQESVRDRPCSELRIWGVPSTSWGVQTTRKKMAVFRECSQWWHGHSLFGLRVRGHLWGGSVEDIWESWSCNS